MVSTTPQRNQLDATPPKESKSGAKKWPLSGGSLVIGLILLALSWAINGQALFPRAHGLKFVNLPWLSGALVNLGSAFVLFAPFYWLSERLSLRVRKLDTEAAETQREVGLAQVTLQTVSDNANPRLHSADRGDESAANAEAAAMNTQVKSALDDAVSIMDELEHRGEGDREPQPESAPVLAEGAEDIVAGAAAAIDVEVRERLSEPARKDEALYGLIALEPRADLIATALRIARSSGLISERGPRCELQFSEFHVRWLLQDSPAVALALQIETDIGDVLFKLEWDPAKTAVDIFVEIGRRLIKSGGYPGADLFFPGQLPRDLSALLAYASKYRFEVTGSHDIEHVVEMLDSGWILTDTSLRPRSYRAYSIDVSRLGELDWQEHIRNKQWEESYSIGAALKIARGLNRPQS